MNLRVAIIEDEPATARHLKHLLGELEPGIEVLATLSSVASAIQWLQANAHNCNLLFMDIQLTDGMSFKIFDELDLTLPVIFITAYNEYALKAFKANGIDYVLKPFDEEALARSIEKFKKFYNPGGDMLLPQLQNVLQQLKMQPAYKRSFLVHYRDKLIPVNTADIQWFYTQHETVQAATATGNYVIEDTLEKLQIQLDPAQFFRANRQFIINRHAIQEVNFFFNGRLLLKVNPAPKENILISKARVAEFKQWMNS
ncbi:MAG TPA: LytTR family DNA-binding domain-containing protein [Chitinophagaceae bacterium]|nr:LytTR family DNA-binding domain-containing protein [Chitinophagaceae bacterium]